MTDKKSVKWTAAVAAALILMLMLAGCGLFLNAQNDGAQSGLPAAAVDSSGIHPPGETPTAPYPVPEVTPISAVSPEGSYRLEPYGARMELYNGGAYPCEGIRLVDVQTGETRWEMAGSDSSFSWLWSPNSLFVAISYSDPAGQRLLVVDTVDFSGISLPDMTELAAMYDGTVDPAWHRQYYNAKIWYNITSDWYSNYVLCVEFLWSESAEGEKNGEVIRGYYCYNVARRELLFVSDGEPIDPSYAVQVNALLATALPPWASRPASADQADTYDQLVAMGFDALPALTAILELPDLSYRGITAAQAVRDILDQNNNIQDPIVLAQAKAADHAWQNWQYYKYPSTPIPDSFAAEEIAAAQRVVEDYFDSFTEDMGDSGVVRWKLLSIAYDPQNLLRRDYINRPGMTPDRIITFMVDFQVVAESQKGRDLLDEGHLGAYGDGDFPGWTVILTRETAAGPWVIADQGY